MKNVKKDYLLTKITNQLKNSVVKRKSYIEEALARANKKKIIVN